MSKTAGLTFAEQTELLSELVPLAENQNYLCTELAKRGFESFRAWQEFNESFCEASDRNASKIYQVEEAKVKFGSPDGLPGFLIGNERGYTSSLLSKMRKERDKKNGVSYQSIPASAPWKRYIDPCIRNLEKQRYEDPQRFLTKYKLLEREIGFSRARETARINRFEKPAPALISDLMATFRLSLQKEFSCFGFSADFARSKNARVVISKNITSGWDLCFTSESEGDFSPVTAVTDQGPITTYLLYLRLYLCAERSIRFDPIPINFDRHLVVPLRYDLLIPEFTRAYSSFSNQTELKVIVAAYSTLYGLVADFFESRIRDYLRRRSERVPHN